MRDDIRTTLWWISLITGRTTVENSDLPVESYTIRYAHNRDVTDRACRQHVRFSSSAIATVFVNIGRYRPAAAKHIPWKRKAISPGDRRPVCWRRPIRRRHTPPVGRITPIKYGRINIVILLISWFFFFFMFLVQYYLYIGTQYFTTLPNLFII